MSGTADADKSVSNLFAAGAINLRKKRIAKLPMICASAPIPLSKYCSFAL